MFPYLEATPYDFVGERDKLLSEYFLLRSPFPVFSMVAAYVLFVKYYGPKMMESRKALELRKTMIIYNVFMVLLNAALAACGDFLVLFRVENLKCIDTFQNPEYLQLSIWYLHIFLLIKLFEFLDTIFAVLRKKESQVSPLHVIHHGSLPITVWIVLTRYPGGQVIFFGWLNTHIHTIMYTYYGLSACGSAMRKYLWWKKYITMLQLSHFVVATLHQILGMMTGCQFPKMLSFLIILNCASFFVLFVDFYKKTYDGKREGKTKIIADRNNNEKKTH